MSKNIIGKTPRSPLLLALALAMAPAFALAQDDRIDDPPDAGTSTTQGGEPTAGPGIYTEPRMLSTLVHFGFDTFRNTGHPREGWYAEMSNMITGSGFLSIGPGYRHYLFDKQAFIDTSAAVSWHFYKMAQARFEAPALAHDHVTLGIQAMWQDQTQVDYFGVGSDASNLETQYELKSTDFVGYAAYRPVKAVTFGAEFGWFDRPDLSSPGGTFKPALPGTLQFFPSDPGTQLPSQPAFHHSELSAMVDTRDSRSHPTSGQMYRAAMTKYVDQGTGDFSFRQYEGEAAQFVQMGSPNWILGFHEWALFSDVPTDHTIPFYLLPTLGGQNTLRSYPDYRFHDRNLAVLNVESRWALFTHLDGALFVDAGNVGHRAADLDLGKRSWGGGLRLHNQGITFARMDIAHGAEGWGFVVRTSDPLRLSRVTRRVAAIPFVP